MRIDEEKKQILDTLSKVSEAKTVSSLWPSGVDALPCITVSLASETSHQHYDDLPYTRKTEWYVRCFGKPQMAYKMALKVDEILTEMNYIRTFRAEDATQNSAQVWMRYQKEE